MWLRRNLVFWPRLVRYHLSRSGYLRALNSPQVKLRATQLALLAVILVAGYLAGRMNAPGCAPVAAAICAEAMASPAPPPPPPASTTLQPVAIATLETPLPVSPPLPPTPDRYVAATTVVVPSLPEKKPAVATVSSDEVREMQAWLKVFGFDPGPIDGYPGSRTTAAVKRYQAARKADETGLLDRSLLRMVRKEAGQS